jgi:hypothetical protein
MLFLTFWRKLDFRLGVDDSVPVILVLVPFDNSDIGACCCEMLSEVSGFSMLWFMRRHEKLMHIILHRRRFGVYSALFGVNSFSAGSKKLRLLVSTK